MTVNTWPLAICARLRSPAERRAGRSDSQRAECLEVWLPGDEDRWRAYLDTDSELVFYCPECADREFSVAPGQWNYHCKGPVHAVVDIALGHGSNLTPGSIGAATVSVIAALLVSARDDGRSAEVFHPSALAGNSIKRRIDTRAHE